MSVLPSDLRFYGSVNMPEADGVTVGGAVDFSKKIMIYDISPAGTFSYVSSASGDTATVVEVAGRDNTGLIQIETRTLNGTTPVSGSQIFERFLYCADSGASAGGPLSNPGGTQASGDVGVISTTAVVSGHTCQSGSANASGTTPALMQLQAGDGSSVAIGEVIRTTGGTGPNQLRTIIATTGYGTDFVAVDRNWSVVPNNTTTYNVHQGTVLQASPNQVTAAIRLFSTSQADVPGGSSRTFYEKIFGVNDNTATALTGCSILIESITPILPGSAGLQIALCNTLNDTNTIANRQTAPASGNITNFTTGSPPQSIGVPSPGNLPSGSAPNTAGAEGVWVALTLPAGTPPYKGAPDFRIAGGTT